MVNEFINDRGDRIRQERLRLDLSQEDFAGLMNKKKMSVFRYEKNEREPDASDLALLDKAGVDIYYLVTGKRLIQNLEAHESEMLYLIRQVDPSQQSTLFSLIKNFAESFPRN